MKIIIGKDNYEIKENLTLRHAISLMGLKMPESLKELYDSILLNDKLKTYKKLKKKLTAEQVYKEHPKYYGEALQIVSDIPKEVMEFVDPESRIEYYTDYLEPTFLDIYFGIPNNYTSQNIEKFEFKNETYFMPETLKIFDKYIPAYKEKALTFTEAADIMVKINNLENIGIKAMSEIVAIYCRKKGEDYNEQIVIDRSELFKDLPLEIVWEVFFCMTELLNRSAKQLTTYTNKANEKLKALVVSE
jgi:hypothetical protein